MTTGLSSLRSSCVNYIIIQIKTLPVIEVA